MINILLSISLTLNVYFIIRMIKINKILKEIQELNQFVKQEKEKTRVLQEELEKLYNVATKNR